MSQRLIIIGARAFGREVCNYARDAGFDVIGFLDDKVDALAGFVGYPPVLSSVEGYNVDSEDWFVCALGDPHWKEAYAKAIESKGGRFANVVHPSAYVGPNVKMGCGCVICPQSVVDCDLTIGNHVGINSLAYVPHDCMLEDYVTVSPGCRLGGGSILRSGVFLGIGSVTIPHVEVGLHSYVAAGAVVTKDVPSAVLVAGVPATIRRSV